MSKNLIGGNSVGEIGAGNTEKQAHPRRGKREGRLTEASWTFIQFKESSVRSFIARESSSQSQPSAEIHVSKSGFILVSLPYSVIG